jgi:hypothetical protein
MGATVQCSVVAKGAGAYSVNASATLGADTLTITIPTISTTATIMAAATGSVSYESEKTVVLYQSSNCQFYFVPGTNETVAPGRIWVAFQCAEVTNGPTMSSCPLSESYAVFEECETTAAH